MKPINQKYYVDLTMLVLFVCCVCLAHVSGRKHKKRIASRRKAERDLINTLTAHSKSLISVTDKKHDSESVA